jgi:hypothetical protein
MDFAKLNFFLEKHPETFIFIDLDNAVRYYFEIRFLYE